jgi:MtrB/PioB family decaheme-associated outer membrane protein
MKTVLGGGSMKRRAGLVTQCLIGAVLAGAASSGALAADTMPVKGPLVQTDAVPYWWFHGSVEAGGRDFLNDPQRGNMTSNAPTAPAGEPGVQGRSLAKYYEYSDVRPGPFANVWLSAGTSDGLYQFDVGGKNIGYKDQRYWLGASKAGQLYFNFMWDQSPHLYSTSAYTIYNVNSNALTLNPCAASAPAKITAATLAPCATPTDIGIKRDTASGDVRWTPNDAWDIRTEYSHLSRTGTQVGMNIGGTAVTSQIPKPVDDTTQNYGLNGEYAGTSPWGQRMVLKFAYNGSTYTENLNGDFFTIQSSNTTQPNGARQSVWPSNNANGFSGTAALDLPWKSRYVGTASYTMMRQNDAFMPNSTSTPTPLPFSSLNGAINTLLINNQLTTKITSDLTSKLTYRYYDFQNDTPELFLNTFNRDYSASSETVNSLSMAYTKQNAGEDLNWRPAKEWNLGIAYGFERYDWTRVDVNATNENSGRVYGDWKPMTWFTLRASGSYGVRRADNYDYLNHVGLFQWGPGCPGVTCDGSELYSSTYRQLMISNRDLWKATVSGDLAVIHNVTFTPFVKYVESKYGVDPATQQGLQDSRKWSAGADITYVMNPNTSFMVGYMDEWGSQLMFGVNCTTSGTGTPNPCLGPQTLTNDTTTVHTFTAAARYGVIPQKLDTELRYTLSNGVDNLNLFGSGSNFTAGVPSQGGQFPQNRTWFQRLDATAVYKFDKEQVAALGWKGDIKAKLHYAWERNAEDNWANDPLTPYNLVVNSNLWLGWNNPNYNVHMLSGSIVASW